MKSPIILEGEPFDWEAGKQAMENLTYENGEVNWWAAFNADPGCMKCPGCEEYLWREGTLVRCPHCSHEWRPNEERGRDG